MKFEEIILDEESLRAGAVINIDTYLKRGEYMTYYITPPAIYDVEVYFSEASGRFAVEVNGVFGGVTEMTFQKVFVNQNPPISYREGGWYRSGSTKVILFNDATYGYEASFVGTISLVPSNL